MVKVEDIEVNIPDEQILNFVSQMSLALNNFVNEMMPILDMLVNSPSTANTDQIKMVTSVIDTELFYALPSKNEEFEDLL